jgi:hypothetical protein
MRLLVLALVVACAIGACNSGSPDNAAAPVPSTTAAGAPAPDAACVAFRGTTEPLATAGALPMGLLVDADVEMVGCLDRITFTFTSLGDGTPPGYSVAYRDVGTDPLLDNGVQISPPGQAFLVVTIAPAASTDARVEDHPETYRGNLRLAYDASNHLQIVQKVTDGVDSVQWVIGLDSVRPYIVDSAKDPTRVSVYIG